MRELDTFEWADRSDDDNPMIKEVAYDAGFTPIDTDGCAEIVPSATGATPIAERVMAENAVIGILPGVRGSTEVRQLRTDLGELAIQVNANL